MTNRRILARSFRVFVAVALVATGTFIVVSACGPDPQQVRREELSLRVKNAVEGHVLPRLSRLVSSAKALDSDVAAYCKGGDEPGWRKAKTSFAASVMSWAAVQHLRFGPMTVDARAQRLSFFPDPRSVVWRQLRGVLAKTDNALLQPGALLKQSVALQGLTVLEHLLSKTIPVGEGVSPEDTYQCALAQAVANTVWQNSKAILDGWGGNGGWQQRIYNPGAGNEAYENQEEAAAELFKSAMLGFQIIRDQQVVVLQQVIGGKKKLSRLPYFRSGLSERYLRASIEGSCELVEKLDIIPFVPKDKGWIAKWIPTACRVLKDKSASLEIPSAPSDLPGKITAIDLRQLRFYSNGLRQIMGRDIAPAIGLTIGFNELDGD